VSIIVKKSNLQLDKYHYTWNRDLGDTLVFKIE